METLVIKIQDPFSTGLFLALGIGIVWLIVRFIRAVAVLA